MKHNTLAVGGGLVLLFASPAAAQLSPPPQSGVRAPSELRADGLTTRSIDAEVAGDHRGALAFADEAIRASQGDPWGHYVRADALVSLGRTDQALAAYRAAESAFSEDDPWGKSLAIWGQANALQNVGRCQDASPLYQRYAGFVADRDEAAAGLAKKYAARTCQPPPPPRYTALQVEAASAEIGGNPQRSLQLADAALRADAGDGWSYFLRGDALLSLHRFDEAVAAYRAAEQRFPASEAWETSLAIWGQANALKEAGRCAEAAPIYMRYATFVEKRDRAGAALGRQYAQRQCAPVATPK